MSEDSSDHGFSLHAQDHSQQPPLTEARESKADRESGFETTLGSTDQSSQKPSGLPPASLHGNQFPIDFGDYRLIRKLGEGGMGVVYEAEQKSLGNRRRALKTIKYSGDPNDRALKRFKNEVQAVAQLEHRHIVPVYHLGQEAGVHYYVMKLVEGKNLREFVNTLKSAVSRRQLSTARPEQTQTATSDHEALIHSSGWSKGETLASQDVLDRVSKEGSTAHPDFIKNFVRMGIQIATALHHVHQQGVVHRDIKPANLILDVDGDVWLTDFGLAQIRDSPSLTAPGDLVGTYHYMSPEQAMGSKRVIVDHRSDIYSLGVTLYELLTLRRAFPGHSRENILRGVQFDNPLPVRKIEPRIPKDLETIVMKAMAKDPNARFQSAEELASELKRFQEGKPLTIRPQSALERLGYWARVHRHVVVSLAAVVIVTFIAAIATAAVAIKENAETLVALQSEKKQKDEANRLLKQSEGLRLAANSSLQVENDPTLGLLLASEAAKRHPGSDANDAIMRAIDIGHEARILSGHTTSVGHVAFNHDGTKLVSSAKADNFGQVNEPAIIWDIVSGKLLKKLQGEQAITSAIFSPDKFRILTASSPAKKNATNDIDDSLLAAPPSLWDATTFEKLFTLQNAFLFQAHPRAFRSDGRQVVLPIHGNKASTFDCVAGGALVEFSGHEARVVFAAFNPRGDQVVTTSDDNTVRIWNAATGAEVLKLDLWRKQGLETQIQDIEWVEFSPDGRRLVTGSKLRGIELFDLENNGQSINQGNLPGTSGVLFGNGDLLATYGLGEMKMVIRSAYDAHWIEDQPINTLIRKAVVSPDDQTVGMLDFSDMRTFHLWDLERREMSIPLGDKRFLINDLAFSPNSSLLATASDDKNVHLWHVSNGRDRATFPSRTQVGHPIFAPSPDGATLAVVTDDPATIGALCDFQQVKQASTLNAKIVLPNPESKRLLAVQKQRLAIHSTDDGSFLGLEAFLHRDVIEAAVSRDCDRVAAFTGGREVVLWIPDEHRRFSLPVGTDPVNTLRFSPTGDQLFALSDDGLIRIWEAKSGRLLQSLQNGGRVFDISFSPDAKTFAVTTNQDIATLYDAGTFAEIRKFSSPNTQFDRIRFSSDGKRLLTYHAFQPTDLVLWDIESGSQVHNLEMGGNVGVAMHPSQPEAIVWSNQEGAVIWRYEDNERVPVTGVPSSSGAYSIDGQHFYLASWVPAVYQASTLDKWPDDIDNANVTRWVREGLQREASIPFSSEAIHQILVNDKDQVFVNALRWHQIDTFNIASHEPIATIPGHYGPISKCLYTSDSKRLITTSWDSHLSIWTVPDGKLLATRNDHQSPILTADLSRDDRYLVSGDRDGNCLIWNLVDGTVSNPVALANSPIRHAMFDREARQVLAISEDGKAHLFLRESAEIKPLDFHTESVEWAEFSPDGTSILVIPQTENDPAPPHELLIVPVNGTAVTKLEFADGIYTAHFHPDSQRIVTTTQDGVVSIKNARSGAIEREFMHEPGLTYAATFDPTGEFIFVSGMSGATLWRLSDGRQWLTLDDRIGDHPWRHAINPFLPGQPRRLLTRRGDTFEYRDLLVDPLPAAQEQLPRTLTEGERKRFLIQD